MINNQIAKILFILSALVIYACNIGINKSINVKDGETKHDDLTSINGDIDIGNDCNIYGDCRAVNGHIEVGRNSQLKDLQAINGRISINKNSHIHGEVNTVNGSIKCAPGVVIEEKLSSINGNIRIHNTRVESDISSINGDVTVSDSSIVDGNIIIEEEWGDSERRKRLDISISNNSLVKGDIIVENDDIIVKVYLSEGGKVLGRIKNAEIIEE